MESISAKATLSAPSKAELIAEAHRYASRLPEFKNSLGDTVCSIDEAGDLHFPDREIYLEKNDAIGLGKFIQEYFT